MNRIALHTLFLSPKGKIIADAFILRPIHYSGGKKIPAKDEYWIDVASEAKYELLDHISHYTWKKEIEIVDIDRNCEDSHKP